MYKQEVIKLDEPKLPFTIPPIPTIIRYRDNFTEKIHTIENLYEQEVVYISANGSICELDFSEYSPEIRGFLLWCFSVSITNKVSTTIVT